MARRNELAAPVVGQVTCYTDYVPNLTLVIEDELLKDARKFAIDRDTTVNQMVREFLESVVRQASDRAAARERLLSRRYPIGKITWTRDELYER
jgi:hypothetical protein